MSGLLAPIFNRKMPGTSAMIGVAAFCFLASAGGVQANAAKQTSQAKPVTSSNPAAERLKQLERQAAASKARAAELSARTLQIEKDLAEQRQKLTDEAMQVRASEEALSRLEAEQAALSAQYSKESVILGGERARLGQLTAGLTRLARIPAGGLLLRYDAPVDAARAQILISAALAATQNASAQAEQEIMRLDELGRELDTKRREGAHAAAQLMSRQAELAALVGKRQSLYIQTDADRKAESERAEKIADEAKDLRDLMARVEAEEKAQRLAAARQAAARGKVASRLPSPQLSGHFTPGAALPVAGTIKIRFGQNDGLGATSHGVTLETRPGATVTAPASGIVRFAGPFRGYREILILEHPGAYHSLIAGMSRINVAVGTSIGSGEPVGIMDERPDAKPELYYELRRNGQFVDPQTVSVRTDVPRGDTPRVDVKGKVQ